MLFLACVWMVHASLWGQSCDDFQSLSTRAAVEYIEHESDANTNVRCVELAFRQIASAPIAEAVPILVEHLGYRRPLNDAERRGLFMHGNGPSALYPAVHELAQLGPPAESALINFLASTADPKPLIFENALYTMLLMHHGNVVAVIAKLNSARASTVMPESKERLHKAASAMLKWCDERSQKACAKALEES